MSRISSKKYVVRNFNAVKNNIYIFFYNNTKTFLIATQMMSINFELGYYKVCTELYLHKDK